MAATARSALMLPVLLGPCFSRFSPISCASSRPGSSSIKCTFLSRRWSFSAMGEMGYLSASKGWHAGFLLPEFDSSCQTNSLGIQQLRRVSVLDFDRVRFRSKGENLVKVTRFCTSHFDEARISTSVVELENEIGAVSPTAALGSLVVPEATIKELPRVAETQLPVGRRKISRKRFCYYFSQGLCTMGDDTEHMAKFTHEWPDMSVRSEDLKKVKSQPFDYFLVLDLEGMVEILEFPVLMVDAKSLRVVDRFHRFVRPAKMSEERIEDYIKNKYGRWGLDRVWHDTAIPFTDVLLGFEKWLNAYGVWDPQSSGKMKSAAFVTCGNWDVKTKIPEQCVTSEIELPPYFNEWINLKDIFFNFYKFRAGGMLAMMKGLKMPMEGTHHVGLDDSHNIARILQRLLAHGATVKLTAKRKAGDPKSVKFTFRFRIK